MSVTLFHLLFLFSLLDLWALSRRITGIVDSQISVPFKVFVCGLVRKVFSVRGFTKKSLSILLYARIMTQAAFAIISPK